MEIFETFYNSFIQLKNESGESTIFGLFISLSSSLSLGLMLFFVCSRYFGSVKSKSIFVMSGLLPLCISGIIWAVASNFFLSLGLIGALSIVRYRTPVKNPLDLAYFLSLITVGIVSTVSPIGAFVIAASLSFSVIALANFSAYKRYGNEFNQELVGKYIYFESSTEIDLDIFLTELADKIIKWELDQNSKKFRCFLSLEADDDTVLLMNKLSEYSDSAYISVQG